MEKQFKEFAENIRLTANQEKDAFTKYDAVCNKLHDSYYETAYDGSSKFLFGSYKTKTNIRPLTEKQDVDVLFKIPKETFDKFKNYESNGPSALLQEIKSILSEKYTTTDEIKGWGKVVLIKFQDNHHNVEVLPAYEHENGTFTIPNSENGGSWEKFNPKEQISYFQESNSKTNGLTAELTRIIKTWVINTATLNYKSYQLLNDVVRFLNQSNFKEGAGYSDYHLVLRDFFKYLKGNCNNDIENFVETAYNRVLKAIEFMEANKPKEASEEWRKIFGFNDRSEFPLVTENPVKESKTRIFTTPSSPYGNY